MIVFSSVTKSFERRMVLDHINLRIEPGEFVCLTGPSGAGKSTMIQLLIRADFPTSGVIEVDGVNLGKLPASILQMYRRRTGVVFQDYKLLSDRTVYENVAFAMEVCGDSDKAIAQRVPALLQQIGLADRAKAFPRELSGGEKARVALARALVHHPMIVIADEPTGNIDPKQSMQIVDLLKKVHSEGATVILASHDQQIIDALQTRVVRLEGGKIIRDSIGGYDTGSKQATGVPSARKHQIFDKQNDAFMAPKKEDQHAKEDDDSSESSMKIKTHSPEKPAEAAKPSNKIKPIAI
ncbi:MAG: ATP-binding cassette domain-containing protein [Candidatus Peribacteraceae bacterium]|nr:ATP-binding cassette domain-containing protein [Candidatus Peribacteraceae bacterium]